MNVRRSNFRDRRLNCLAFCALFSICFWVPATHAATTDKATSLVSAGHDLVSELVEQLGDDDYYSRQAAEEKLLSLGSDVFDRLHSVQEHPDLEISARASYILRKLKIEWVHPEDPNDIKLLLDNYDELSATEKMERMERLATLDSARGLAVLCRLARFEPSLQMSRFAALKIIRLNVDVEFTTQQLGLIEAELGSSKRVPVEWIRSVANAGSLTTKANQAQWFAIIDQEVALLEEDSPDTERRLALELIDHCLELGDDTRDEQLLFDLLRRRTEVSSGKELANSASLYYAFNWVWRHKQFAVSPLLEKQYATEIEGDRLLTYFVALARWKLGEPQEAEEIASRAYEMKTDDARQREGIASVVGELGRHDWAEREWQYVVDELPVLQSASSRRWLASLRYHDRGENKRAAEILAELCTAIEANKRLNSQVLRNSDLRLFFSQRDYFRACQARDEGDYPLQRKLLDSAFRYENLDADVLIAMYRSPEADEEYREKTRQRIRQAAEELEGFIKERPDDSQSFNHWAWLISNTEGDYDRAVEYSKRSLELTPESPSFLDTLGRCYYAAGKLENAVEVQRQAIELHPHLQVMRKQLKMFEAELAKRQNPTP